MTALAPRSATELATALRETAGPVRLVGTRSRQHRLPPADGATEIDLTGLDRITRLDAGDHTCSVGAGLAREVLDAALAEHGLWLPCAGGGTIGGLFASDLIGATTAGGPQPRTLLIGIEAVLRDGTEFRSGARVAKSVAGFDLHRLFVGSHGRLFVAAELHLRLKPRPRASTWFRNAGLTFAAALELFLHLRRQAVPPAMLHLLREAGDHAVVGRIDGRPAFVARALREHGLREGPAFDDLHLEAPAGGEVLAGSVVPSQCAALLESTSESGPFVLHGGGRFELATATPATSDALLARWATLGAHACVALGEPTRRGRGTPLDPGQARLAAAMARTFDPEATLV